MPELHMDFDGNRPTRRARRALWSWIGRPVLALSLLILLGWSVLAIYFSNLPGPMLRTGAATVFGLGTLSAFAFLPDRRRTVHGFLVAFAGVLHWWALIPPSHDRHWLPEYAVLPRATFDGERVTVHGIRAFDHRTAGGFTPRYHDKTFDLGELTSVDFALSYWDGNTDIAHFMVSFGFRHDDYLAVSAETRREVGEAWSPLRGLFKQYELIIVLGDERDLLRLRTSFREEEVYLYPTVLTPEQGRAIFVDLLDRVNRLHDEPEFYHTLTHNCMTSLLPHIEPYRKKKGFDLRLLLNGLTDQLAYENGMIDSRLSFPETRKRHHINQYIRDDPEDYSRSIRPHLRSG